MKAYGPWVPIWCVLLSSPLLFAGFLFIPETLPPAAGKGAKSLSAGSSGDGNPGMGDTTATYEEPLLSHAKELVRSLAMLRDVNIPLVLVTFLVQNARMTAYTQILAQYISKHFGWKIADISFLLSPLGLLNLAVLLLLPRVSDLLLRSPRFGLTALGKDLLLTQLSTLFIIAGAVIEGFGLHLAVFLFGLFVGTFGAADSPLARAALSHYVEPEYTSRLYALISIVEVVGAVLGGPALAWFFDRGLRWKGFWIGLPWFYVAALHVVALICLGLVRPPKQHEHSATRAAFGGRDNWQQLD